MPSFPAPIYVCGATASGKTAHALRLAEEHDGEIVNADAFQLFRRIEIISAAPSEQEKSLFPHHLFGVLEPGEHCDAGRYCEMVAPVISELQARGKTPIIVGGSGLYLKFLTHGPSPLPKGDEVLRTKLDARTTEDLLEELETLDPVEAAQVNRGNKRYVSRSLEICLLTGGKVSELRDGWELKTRELDQNLTGYWLVREREELHRRIALRTHQMLDEGAIEEVEKLDGIGGNWEKAIGVKEIRRYLGGEISRDECEELIVFATRQYAKRQETWFRRERWLQRMEL
ncbi:tRNA (adenosine(37)-N6)-dimethylallyltransferase MiaA [Luteolibacter sp. AS25]|uniref:tRNA (adenosine(37)-N6)-dimethylallyltransferase MiaA n=1 Tax=Luteolibacter sp. AS25 TaxID=3135776 RepID=UPI00398AF6BA